MSYGVVRVQKMTSGSVKGIEIHDRREKSQSHSNPDIDFSKSDRNFDLCPNQNKNFYQVVKERIAKLDLPKAVRKDAIVMSQVLVTSDSDFFNKLYFEDSLKAQGQFETYGKITDMHVETKTFFQKAYDFLAERYGKENIVSATVHLDEKTPHMHFNFVPVTADGRLCAKEIFTRQSLMEQQTAFYERVGKEYGLKRGEGKESGKRRKHFETAEYKDYANIEQNAQQRARNAIKKANELNSRINDLERIFSDKEKKLIEVYENKKIALEGKLEGLQEQIKGTQLKINEITYIQPQKTITGAIKGVTVEDIENLKRTAIMSAKALNNNKQLSQEVDRLNHKCEYLEKQIPSVMDKLKDAKEQSRLIEVEKAFNRLPDKVKKQLILTQSKKIERDGR